jgi:hypothetical protein
MFKAIPRRGARMTVILDNTVGAAYRVRGPSPR